MTLFDMDRTLGFLTLLVDTREHPTQKLGKRIKQTGLPYKRQKLEQGDYSCQCELPDGQVLDFSDKVAVERKMNLDELCLCFGRERGRFEREFERAKAAGCRIYLLVEDGSWEKDYKEEYRSLYNPKALIASINAYRARYGMQLDFCTPETTGRLIRDILYREVKEYLQG